MNLPQQELPTWMSKRPISSDELAQRRKTDACRLTDEEIQALCADMSASAKWMREELRRRRMTRAPRRDEPKGAAKTAD